MKLYPAPNDSFLLVRDSILDQTYFDFCYSHRQCSCPDLYLQGFGIQISKQEIPEFLTFLTLTDDFNDGKRTKDFDDFVAKTLKLLSPFLSADH